MVVRKRQERRTNVGVCSRRLAGCSSFSDLQFQQALLFLAFWELQISRVPQPKEIRDPSAFQVPPSASGELPDLTERRVRFVLRRLGWRVPRAEVQMSDVNGPRGGIGKRCQVELRTHGADSVVVASVANDWRTALDNALARLWRRGSDTRRTRQRFVDLER